MDLERHRQLRGPFHGLAHQRLDRLLFGFGDLEDELVVHLEDHARPEPALLDRLRGPEHGQLDDVRRGSLDGIVERDAAAGLLQGPVGRAELGDLALPSEDRFGVAALPRLFDDPVEILPDLRPLGEIAVDELLGLARGRSELAGQGEGRGAVDDAEIDDLGPPPRLFAGGLAEDEPGRLLVDVAVGEERFDQGRVARKVGQDAELDLGIVRGQQDVALVRDEGPAEAGAPRPAGVTCA